MDRTVSMPEGRLLTEINASTGSRIRAARKMVRSMAVGRNTGARAEREASILSVAEVTRTETILRR